MNGKITNIETMGSADGPGVRLVIFLAGCKLRCLYCHNPETWNMSNFTQIISPEEVLKLYNKYKIYYGDKGGVTFSGGEPLLQSQFLLDCVKLLKENHIHVALDTAGVGEEYHELLKLIDLVILDVKAVDDKEYKLITGREMFEFNAFLESCQKLNKKLWLRQVIVPNLNDDEEHILKFKEFSSKIRNVERIELLPYHSMAKSKYEQLNIEYRLKSYPDMDKDKCNELEKILKSF